MSFHTHTPIVESGFDTSVRLLRENNKTLIQLFLDHSKLEDDKICVLADVLKSNETLTHLILNNNKISDDGAQALSEMLKVNVTLTYLDLSHNDIHIIGYRCIFESLKINRTLIELKLAHGNIRKSSAIIADALNNNGNDTLSGLDLSHNNLDDAELLTITEALKTNRGLTYLDVSYNNHTEIGLGYLIDLLESNASIKDLRATTAEERGKYGIRESESEIKFLKEQHEKWSRLDALHKQIRDLLQRNQRYTRTKGYACQ